MTKSPQSKTSLKKTGNISHKILVKNHPKRTSSDRFSILKEQTCHSKLPTCTSDDTIPSSTRSQSKHNSNLTTSFPPTFPNNLFKLTKQFHPCGNRRCKTCPLIKFNRFPQSKGTQIKVPITSFKTEFKCTTAQLVYLIECKGYKHQYIGQTLRSITERTNQHRADIRANTNISTLVLHFATENHTKNDITIIQLEKIPDNIPKREAEELVKQAQTKWIFKLGTLKPTGMNAIIRDLCRRT